jgi:hypothetical protein
LSAIFHPIEDKVGEPIGCVELTQVMPNLLVNDATVKHLQQILATPWVELWRRWFTGAEYVNDLA